MQLIDGNIYMAISLRNAGPGLRGRGRVGRRAPCSRPPTHRTCNPTSSGGKRDLYIAPNDIGFWQAAIREPEDPDYAALRKDIEEVQPFTVELLYGDHEGGQRTITRFGMIPYQNDEACMWYPNVALHWNLDRPDPR